MCTMCGMPNLLRAIHLSPVLSNPWEDTYHNTIDSANENPRDGSRKNEPVLFWKHYEHQSLLMHNLFLMF